MPNNSTMTQELTSRNLLYAHPYDADLKKKYGAVGGGADATSALQAFFNDSTAKTLFIPAGTYTITKVEYTGTVDKHVVCEPGVILRWTGNDSMVRITPPVQWAENVSAINSVDSWIGENPVAASTTLHVELTMGNAHNLYRGQVVKIVSNDELLNGKGSASSNKRRKGEFAIIASETTGTTAVLSGMLRDSYDTVPRVVLLPTTKFTWTGGTVDCTSNTTTATPEFGMFELLNLVRPEIKDVHSINGNASMLHPVGCHSPRFTNITARRLRNEPTNQVFGYLLNDDACDGLEAHNLTGWGVRHVVTTNTRVTAANSTEFAYYGRSRNGVITNSHGFGCSNTPFDTHDEVDTYLFQGCVAVGTYAGAESGGGGFSARGYNVTFDNCVANGCRGGFALGTIDRVALINCRVLRTRLNAIQVNLSTTANQNARVTIRGGYYENMEVSSPIASFGESDTYPVDVFMDSVTFATINTGAGTSRFFECSGAKVRARNITLDLTNYTPTSAPTNTIFRPTTSNNDFRIDGFEIIPPISVGASTSWGRLVEGATAGLTGSFVFTGVKCISTLDFTGASTSNGNPFGLSIGNMSGATLIAQGEKTVNGTFTRTGYMAATAAASFTINVDKIADKDIVIRLSGSAGAVTFSTLPTTNRRNGDTLLIVNDSNGIVTQNSVAIAAAGSARFVFANNAWRAA